MLKIIKNKVYELSWEDVSYSLFYVFVVILLNFLYCVMHADRSPKGYYLDSKATDAGIAYRIKVSVDYCEDDVAFTTTEPNLALSTLKELNEKQIKEN